MHQHFPIIIELNGIVIWKMWICERTLASSLYL